MRARFFHPYPKYLQIRDLLCQRIAQNHKVGDRLPTEHELATEFRVSRETIREALDGLERDGLIRRRPRVGTVVAALPRLAQGLRMTGLVEDFTALRLDTESIVLDQRFVMPSSELRESLCLPPGQLAFRIERLRNFDGAPLAYHEAFLPKPLGDLLAGRDLRKVALMHEFDRLGKALREEEQRIEAAVADTNLARLLKVPLGAPLLVVTRRCVTRRGALRILFRTHFRADRYYYTVALGTESTAAPKPRAAAGRRPARRSPMPETDKAVPSQNLVPAHRLRAAGAKL